MQKRIVMIAVSAAIAALAWSARAQSGFRIPYLFNSGAIASANEVNTNFKALEKEINRLREETKRLRSELSDLKSKTASISVSPDGTVTEIAHGRAKTVFQSDCNIVMYIGGRAVWFSGAKC